MKYDPVTYDFESFKKQLLADPGVAAEYEKLKDEYLLIKTFLQRQKKRELKNHE